MNKSGLLNQGSPLLLYTLYVCVQSYLNKQVTKSAR